MIAINSGQIADMVAQIRAAIPAHSISSATPIKDGPEGVADFGQIFKAQMDQVNALHQKSTDLGERFSLGDDSVNLSDVMISAQKSSIAMQSTIQVRNKLVTAYHDIMNMQI